jgi:peroxiredoxin
LRRDHRRFVERGGAVVCVSQGTLQERAEFVERHGPYPFEMLCDPTRAAYVAWGLARGTVWQVLFAPEVLAKGMEAYQEGHRIGPIVGDPFQLPGTFVVGTDGIVRFSHPGTLSSDFPPSEAVLAAL